MSDKSKPCDGCGVVFSIGVGEFESDFCSSVCATRHWNKIRDKLLNVPERQLETANAKIAELTKERDDLKHDIERHLRICTELEARLAAIDAQPVVAWMLEWTHSGDEIGQRLYDDERHCLLDAQTDGGVCKPLIAKPASNPDTAQEKQS